MASLWLGSSGSLEDGKQSIIWRICQVYSGGWLLAIGKIRSSKRRENLPAKIPASFHGNQLEVFFSFISSLNSDIGKAGIV